MAKEAQIGVYGATGRIGSHAVWATEKRTDSIVQHLKSRGSVEDVAYLLTQDTKQPGVELAETYVSGDGKLIINDREVAYEQCGLNEQKQTWGDKPDSLIVVETTGNARSYELAKVHLEAGALAVIISCPSKDDTPQFVFGVNHHDYDPSHHIVSAASCSTNLMSPPLHLINTELGINWAILKSIHPWTRSQSLVDGRNTKDRRRGRAAPNAGLIPTSTGASSSIQRVVPNLNAELSVKAIRTPDNHTTLGEFVVGLQNPTTEEQVVDMFEEWSSPKGPFNGVVGFPKPHQDVGADFTHSPLACIFDPNTVRVMQGGHLLEFSAWQDPESGYTHNLLNLAVYMQSLLNSH